VYELARYVEQSNPQLVEGLLTAAARNDVNTPAADASSAPKVKEGQALA
jgi:hypothetical protein